MIIILAVLALGLAGYVSYLSYLQKKNLTPVKTTPETNQTSIINDSTDKTNIHIFSPKSGDTVGLPIKVLGEVRVFENTFQIRVKDGKGNILDEETVMAQNGDVGQYNLFSKDINYPAPKTSEGTIEVFDYSAKDGSEIDKIIIPVKFQTITNALNIAVYFPNSQKDPNAMDCKNVYPVYRRVAYTKETAAVAIAELLKGPNQEEATQGYSSNIPFGTKLQSLNIKNSTATADFDQTLQAGVGGSCMVASIRSQITQTIKQFGTVNNVIISIDGQSEDILQP